MEIHSLGENLLPQLSAKALRRSEALSSFLETPPRFSLRGLS